MELNGRFFNTLIKEEFSDDMTFLMNYLRTEEQKREFIKTYMYILSTGMGDGITESAEFDIINEAEKEYSAVNEAGVGDLFSFFKGRKIIKKYYSGLEKAANTFIDQNKKIDKARDSQGLEGKKLTDERDKSLKGYENFVKQLDAQKKILDDLKKDNEILTKYDDFANKKYKLKMAITGKKMGVSVAKLKGAGDSIDDIKKQIADSEKEIATAEKEVKNAEDNMSDAAKALQKDAEKITGERDKLKEELDKIGDKDSEEYKKKKEELDAKQKELGDKEGELKKELGGETEETTDGEETGGAGATGGSGDEETGGAGATGGSGEETDTTPDPAEVEADDAEKEAEKAKADAEVKSKEAEVAKAKADQEKAEKEKEEANKKLEKDIDRLEKYTQKIKDTINKKKEEMKGENDGDKKNMLQDVINQLSSGLTDKESKLKTLWDKLGESYIIPLSVFYEMSLLESELLDMLHNLNENA